MKDYTIRVNGGTICCESESLLKAIERFNIDKNDISWVCINGVMYTKKVDNETTIQI